MHSGPLTIHFLSSISQTSSHCTSVTLEPTRKLVASYHCAPCVDIAARSFFLHPSPFATMSSAGAGCRLQTCRRGGPAAARFGLRGVSKIRVPLHTSTDETKVGISCRSSEVTLKNQQSIQECLKTLPSSPSHLAVSRSSSYRAVLLPSSLHRPFFVTKT